jgi:hypothetical protein
VLNKPGSDGGNGLGKRSWAPPLPSGKLACQLSLGNEQRTPGCPDRVLASEELTQQLIMLLVSVLYRLAH